MRKITAILMCQMLLFPLFAQEKSQQQTLPYPYNQNPSFFDGGLGMTWINGISYMSVSLYPEFTFGNFGLGLRIDLLFNTQENFKFRTIGWEDASAIARSVRYIRYAHKGDPFYVRLGSLMAARIGHGFQMWYYSNEAEYDNRKFGLALDLDLGLAGMESVTSNLAKLEIIGGRLYFRPLYNTELPILSNLEFGATVVSDRDPDNNSATDNDITTWGLDVGLPIIKSNFFQTTLYFDYGKFIDFGEGRVLGINFGFPDAFSMVSLEAKLERRWLGDQFIPNYFNTLYELERGLPDGYDKRSILAQTVQSKGLFGELAGNIAGMFILLGNFQKQEGIPGSGIMHLEARLVELLPSIMLLAYYDKTNIDTFKDAATLDIFSQAVAEVGYKAYGFLWVSLRYRWNFIETAPNVYEPQERFEPRVSFVFTM
jgi:hypothetical protein